MDDITNKKPTLYVDNNLNIDRNIQNNQLQTVIHKSRWLIENMIQYKKQEDIKTKVVGILLFIAFNLPYIGLDIYFCRNTNNLEQYLYITISINQRLMSVFISSYYMLVIDIDSLYKQIKNKNGFYYLCNIDMNWCQYYSSIGILLAIKYYILHKCFNIIYLYILTISILKLCTMYYFITQT
jgi:hypothetical protein